LAATARDVGRLRSFGEKAFVTGVDGEKEAIFDFFRGTAKFGEGELQAGLLGWSEETF
jgi:hypothetical protein